MKRREFLTGTIIAISTAVIPIPLHVFTGGRWSESSNGYLSISLLQKDGKEVTYTGYQRQIVPRTSRAWLIEDLTVTNLTEIAFPILCSHEPIELTGVGIYDQYEECLLKSSLTASLVTFSGLIPSFLPGDLKISLEKF